MNQSTGQIAIYQTDDGQTQIEVRVEQDTLWLTLLQMAELFDRDKSVISRHLKNVFDTGELPREATVAKNATVQTEGGRQVSREIEYFNLDAVISVGYRVNSIKGTQFRIWATQRLREYLVQGYLCRPTPDSMQDYYTKLRAIESRMESEGIDLVVRPSILVKRLAWCTGVEICVPVDVRTDEEVRALALLARHLLKGETNLANEFPGYEYGRAEWLAEAELRSQDRLPS